VNRIARPVARHARRASGKAKKTDRMVMQTRFQTRLVRRVKMAILRVGVMMMAIRYPWLLHTHVLLG
jgi:hypothetical protein